MKISIVFLLSLLFSFNAMATWPMKCQSPEREVKFFKAIDEEDLKTIKEMVKEDHSVLIEYECHRNPFVFATKTNNLDLVKYFSDLAIAEDFYEISYDEKIVGLKWSIGRKAYDSIRYIFKHMFENDSERVNAASVGLLDAANEGDYELSNYFISQGANIYGEAKYEDPYYQHISPEDPLFYAVKAGNYKLVLRLIALGADVTKTYIRYENILYWLEVYNSSCPLEDEKTCVHDSIQAVIMLTRWCVLNRQGKLVVTNPNIDEWVRLDLPFLDGYFSCEAPLP